MVEVKGGDMVHQIPTTKEILQGLGIESTISECFVALTNKYGQELFKPFLLSSRIVYNECKNKETFFGTLYTSGKGAVFLQSPGKELMLVDRENGELRFRSLTKGMSTWFGRERPVDQVSIGSKESNTASVWYFDRDRDTCAYVQIKQGQATGIRIWLDEWLPIVFG